MQLTRYAPVRDAVDLVRTGMRLISPSARAADRLARRNRDETDQLLARLCGTPVRPFEGEVLIDAQWDNPNYWFRVALLRAAIGLPNGREVGVLGPFARTACSRTMARLGIHRHVSHPDIPVDIAGIRREADRLIASTHGPEDVLGWQLPGGVPGAMVYDGVLKRQRLAALDIHRRDFCPLVIEALVGIERARRLLNGHDFRLVVTSHPFGFTYGTIAHQALARGVPVVMPFGLFGVLRMTHMRRPEDLTAFYDRPSRAEMDGLSPERADALAKVGRQYLDLRFGGKADDLASVYAYQKRDATIDRAGICRKFGWDPAKPIVGFYASNWYDWPHQLGMTQFRDFLDWTEATFQVAGETTAVNWLFKPHPCEDWFGGIALSEILARMRGPAHIGVAEKGWNNTPVMCALDALVTYHGTAGIEFASLGKPVLVPDRGKYEDCGFVKVAADRGEYLRLLRGPWWQDMDVADAKRRAEIFAGLWFCAPAWQDRFILADDSRQNALYEIIPRLVADNETTVASEIAHLRDWFASGHPYSHTFKMVHADGYRLSNVGAGA